MSEPDASNPDVNRADANNPGAANFDFQSYLRQRFPEMTPVASAPSLGSVNGIGTMVYGHRDDDPETGTYVVTHVFCVVFLPILTLGAYRVANAPGGGWYFLGKVPMSGLARNWNWLLAIAILTGSAVAYFQIRARNPEHIAAVKLEEGDRLAAAGKVGQAAELYRTVANGGTSEAPKAVEKVSQLLDNSTADAGELARAYQVAVELHRAGKPIDRIFERGLSQVNARADADPQAALALADALLPFVGDVGRQDAAKALHEVRFKALQRKLAKSPDDLDTLSEIALILEARLDLETCEKLLAPHAAKLGSREGARILGLICSHKDKLDAAAVLLTGYTDERVKGLTHASQNRNAVVKRLLAAQDEKIRNGTAPGLDYQRLKTADKQTQAKMVDEYVSRQLFADLDYRKAMDEYHKEMIVVQAAMELGIVWLRQGQAVDDPERRKQAMEKAEKAFLSISGAARDSVEFADDFNLRLGQVYYWLGKHDEGKKLFDHVLAGHKNDTRFQIVVANALRDVGSDSESRTLVEQAYNSASNPKLRFDAAGLRAHLSDEMDERIDWMEKSDPDNKHDQATLQHWRGERALSRGNEAEAVAFLRKAVDLFGSLPETSATLNNGAFVQLALFRATGDRAYFQHAAAMQEKALQLNPSDSIVVVNSAENAGAVALWDVMGKDLNLSTLRRTSNHLSLLAFLYNDGEGLSKLREKVRSNPGVSKAIKDLERGQLLSPKTPRSYQSLSWYYGVLKDLPALRKLDERMRAVELDLGGVNRRERDNQHGKDDDKVRKDLPGNIALIRTRLEASRGVGGATYAVAVSDWFQMQSLANLLIGRLSKGELDSLNQLAEDAFRQAPSQGARSTQVAALLLRAHNDLLMQSDAYAALAKKAERALGSPAYLVAFALSRPDPLRDACLAHPDVRRVLDLLKEESALDPDGDSIWSWVCLKAAFPEDAARIARNIQANEVYLLKLKITEKVSPLNPHVILDRCWLLQLQGNDAEAAAILDKARKDGVILPE